jgi:hypothetical protein
VLLSATTTPVKSSSERTQPQGNFDPAREKKRAADQKFKEWKARKDNDVAADRAKRAANERRYRQEVANIQATRTDVAYEAWVQRKQRNKGGVEGSKSRKIAVKTLTLTLVH